MINNNGRLGNLEEAINDALNSYGLKKLNPIFSDTLEFRIERKTIHFQYPRIFNYPKILQKKEDLVNKEAYFFINDDGEVNKDLYPTCSSDWYIIEDIAIFLPIEFVRLTPIKYYLVSEAPIYIKCFSDAIRKFSKTCLIEFREILPLFLRIEIDTAYNFKKDRVNTLMHLTKWFVNDYDDSVRKEIDSISKDKDMPFKKAFDQIIKLSGQKKEIDFSYCLACGDFVSDGKKFCNAKKTKGYKNKDNCLNKFNYWLKARLGISNPVDRAKFRKKAYNELQMCISSYPLHGFEEFKGLHPRLY